MSKLEELGISASAAYSCMMFEELEDPVPYLLITATNGEGDFTSKSVLPRRPCMADSMLSAFLGDDIANGTFASQLRKLKAAHPQFDYSGIACAFPADSIQVPNTPAGVARADQALARYKDGKRVGFSRRDAMLFVGPGSKPIAFVRNDDGKTTIAPNGTETLQGEIKLMEEINRRFLAATQ